MPKQTTIQYTAPGGNVWHCYSEMVSDATHLLIAGTTGSGKSTIMNALISTAMKTSTPAKMQFVLIDPKKVELYKYRYASRFCAGYADTSEATVNLLDWAISEMDSRYCWMRGNGVSTWTGKRLVACIDELADLMISADARRIKAQIQKLTQLGRAAGVSVWAATQAPSRKVIPAEITLNFTDRLALRCVSAIESRQIVQVAGAEKLPRHGVGLYFDADGIKRIDLPLVPESEVQSVISYWNQNPGYEISTNWLGKEIRKKIA